MSPGSRYRFSQPKPAKINIHGHAVCSKVKASNTGIYAPYLKNTSTSNVPQPTNRCSQIHVAPHIPTDNKNSKCLKEVQGHYRKQLTKPLDIVPFVAQRMYKDLTISRTDLEEQENNSRCTLRGSVRIATHGQPCLFPELLYSFRRRRVEQIFLIFAWIHIHQRGIWDMETRKLSRPPSKNFFCIQSIPLPFAFKKTPGRFKPRTWQKT